jgi:hypothetical protein
MERTMSIQADLMQRLVAWSKHERDWMRSQVAAMRRGERRIGSNDVDDTARWIDELERRVAEINQLLADIAEEAEACLKVLKGAHRAADGTGHAVHVMQTASGHSEDDIPSPESEGNGAATLAPRRKRGKAHVKKISGKKRAK